MPTSYRIWWLIACCALAIGLLIEADAPGEQAPAAVTAVPAPTSLAARPRHDRGA